MVNATFIEFLAKSGAIQFGEFTLKSGRISPFFISTGVLADGASTYTLATHYARKINEVFGDRFDILFGPAYKGIPLAVATSIALQKELNITKHWLFDRKEKKTYGDASGFVGVEPDAGARIVILDDVLTTGETKIEAIQKLQHALKAEVVGIVIAVDRQERGRHRNAIEEFTENTGVPVHAIATIQEVFEQLHGRPVEGKTYVDDALFEQFQGYKKKYG